MLDKAVLVRVIIFLLAWLNQYLVGAGYPTIPVLEEETISNLVVFIASIWTLATTNKIRKEKDE